MPAVEQLLAGCLKLSMQLTATIHSLQPFAPSAIDGTTCCGGNRPLFVHLFCSTVHLSDIKTLIRQAKPTPVL